MDIPLFGTSEPEAAKPSKKKKEKRKRLASLVDSISSSWEGTEWPDSKQQKADDDGGESDDESKRKPHPGPNPKFLPEDTPEGKHTGPYKVYAGNLSSRVKECHLEALILDVLDEGDVILNCKVMKDEEGKPKGFGFVTLSSEAAFNNTLKLSGQDLLGNRIELRVARETNKRAKPGERRYGTISYKELAEKVDKRNKRMVEEQVAYYEERRKDQLAKIAKKEEEKRQFVEAGGVLPGGLGHGYGPSGKPLLHSGYANFFK